MFRSNPGVRRPVLYAVAAVVAIALAIPLAANTGQLSAGGIFDECYAASCDGRILTADAGR